MITKKEILKYTIRNSSGIVVNVTNYGATITDIIVPDKRGVFENVVLGFDALEDYKENTFYIGSTIGRYTNRISKGQFKVDNKAFQLSTNDNGNNLHGGFNGFHTKFWDVKILSESSLQLAYESLDGEEGFPGNLKTEIIITVNPDNSVRIDYTSTTDKATPVSLTNHTYFNLSYGHIDSILDHELTIMADRMTPVDDQQIPTGVISPVTDSFFDFRTKRKIGSKIPPGGYDHNFVLNKSTDKLSLAAILYNAHSGRKLELLTTEPCLQFYTGNFLDGSLKGKNSVVFNKHAGVCLEPQQFPDSSNQPAFPSAILQAGKIYKQTSVFKFSVE